MNNLHKVKMLRDCILVRVIPEEEKSVIELPDDIKQERMLEGTYGEAVVTGNGCETVKEGDHLLYKSYVGNVLRHEYVPTDGLYIVVSENDVLAVFEQEMKN